MQYVDGEVLIVNILKGLWVAWPLYALILVMAVGKLAFRFYEMKRLARSGVNEIDNMDGKTFEKYLEVLFRKLGYKVERTNYVGDYGADLVVCKDGAKKVIQAKRYKKKVGVKGIQEAVAAKGMYACQKAMVVTNSFYTTQAEKLAKANHVELWDRRDLVKAALSVQGKAEQKTHIEPDVDLDVLEHCIQTGTDTFKCVVCGDHVSEKVRQYCIDHPEKFMGKIYCFKHQKNIYE